MGYIYYEFGLSTKHVSAILPECKAKASHTLVRITRNSL